MKKEIPILMSTPMVIATLGDLKTVTRRTSGLEVINKDPDDWQFEWADFSCDKPWRFTQKSTVNAVTLAEKSFHQESLKCPYGKPGDILWVRETWGTHPPYNDERPSIICGDSELHVIHKKSGFKTPVIHKAGKEDYAWGMYGEPKWKPSIHMPKAAARIWLDPINIIPQRLHDITEEQAICEGVQKGIFREGPNTQKKEFQLEISCKGSPIGNYLDGFKFIWHQLNGRESWNKNPWVWVVSFKVLSTTGKPLYKKLSEIDAEDM